MIGSLDPSNRRVTVVGAGIAGLLAADALDLAGYEVSLVEKSARAGGLIETRATPFGMAETAAHSLLVTSEARALFDRLRVELLPLQRDSRARYVLRGGRMRRMPLGPFEIIGAFARAYFVLSQGQRGGENAQSGREAGDLSPGQTLASWADRHLGRAARDYLLGPFVRGIYGAEPSDLELAAAFPSLVIPPGHSLISYQLHRLRMRRNEKITRDGRETHQGRHESKREMMAPVKGMGAVVDALAESLRLRLGPRFQLGRAIDELPSDSGNLILAVPASEAARLLAHADRELAGALGGIAYTPLVSVTAFVEVNQFADSRGGAWSSGGPGRKGGPGAPPRGVGVLVPAREKDRRILGVLFNSSSFPGRAADGMASFTVMIGNTAAGKSAIDLSDGELGDLVADELRAVLGAKAIAHLEINRWPRAIPRYDHALASALKKARKSHWCSRSGHLLFGNYTGQVSLRGMIEALSGIKPASR